MYIIISTMSMCKSVHMYICDYFRMSHLCASHIYIYVYLYYVYLSIVKIELIL